MLTIQTQYLGDLRTQSRHLQSGAELITDAPTDNEGRGEAFSPTDLLSTALGTCMLTIMGITARKHNFSIDGASVNLTKIMTSAPRRVGEIIVEFNFPKNNFSEREQKLLEAAAKECPVGRSLHPDLKQTLIFKY